ncbi:MAG: GNAT family N-acetyltransferase [Gemmatimonadota bacterium]|nr:GNAT family N-acetyltransferase [Gemmatimonadota bacterium]
MTERPVLTVRPAVPGDWDAIAAFYSRHQAEAARTIELLCWRDRDVPASGGNHPTLAFDGDALCGIVNSVPLELSLRGERVPACLQQDSLVDPAMRGRGVGKQLVLRAAERAPVILAKATSNAMYGLRKSVGFEDRENANHLVCVLRPFTAASIKVRGAFVMFWLYALLRRPRIPAGLTVRPLERFDEAVDLLTRRIAAGDEVVPVKSSRYLSWRYQDVPGRAYLLLRADGPEGLRGCAVVRLPSGPGGPAWLVDVIVPTDDLPALAALVSASREAARTAGCGVLKTFATSPRVRWVLRRGGFVGLRTTPRFTCLVRAPLPGRNLNAARWNFWHGDGDGELY